MLQHNIDWLLQFLPYVIHLYISPDMIILLPLSLDRILLVFNKKFEVIGGQFMLHAFDFFLYTFISSVLSFWPWNSFDPSPLSVNLLEM